MENLKDLVKEVFEKLKKLKIEFLFSGAIAANFYRTSLRGTMDIDIAIPFNEQVLNDIKNEFQDYEVEDWELIMERLEIKKKRPDVIVPEFMRLKHSSDYEIDFFPLYSNFILRKRRYKLLDFEIDIIGPEDLIILKGVYDRYKDRDDIVNILENKELDLDLDYLLKELSEYEKDEIITLIKRVRGEYLDKK